MEERAHGIILRTRPLTETSLIVQWLTPDAGRISTVAKGARRPKSPFVGKLDLYYEADFTYQRARKSTLHTLREISLRATHPKLRTDLTLLEQAARASRRIEKLTEEETPLPEIFQLFQAYLNELPPVIAFEIKLLNILGLQPNLKTLQPGAAKALEHLTTHPFEATHHLKLSAAQSHEIETFLNHNFAEALR